MPVWRDRLLSGLLGDPSGGRYVRPECGRLLLVTYTVRLDGAAEWSFLPLGAPEGERSPSPGDPPL